MQPTMLAIDQKVKDFAIHVGHNNIIARDTSPKVRRFGFPLLLAGKEISMIPTNDVTGRGKCTHGEW